MKFDDFDERVFEIEEKELFDMMGRVYRRGAIHGGLIAIGSAFIYLIA